MTAIPFTNQLGQVIGLDLKLASDGSGNYVLVVALDDAHIELGTVDINTIYNLNPPVLDNGQTGALQSDVRGNLKVDIAASEAGVSFGAVDQGAAGLTAWKVDPSGVTAPVSLASLPALSAGTNAIGGTYAAPTALARFAIMPGSSAALESSHVLKTSAGNLYSLYVLTTAVGGYLMTFNATSVPADGPVTPVECIPVGPNSIAGIGVDGSPPDHYSQGIVAVFSTTGPLVKTTTRGYGRGLYGRGHYSAPALVFFKWNIV